MKKNNVIFSTSLSYTESVLFDPFDLPNGQDLSDDPKRNELMQTFANDMREATLVDAIEQWRHDEKVNFESWQHLVPYYYLVVYDIGRWDGHDDFLKDAMDGNYLSDSRIRRYCRSAAPVIRRVYGL